MENKENQRIKLTMVLSYLGQHLVLSRLLLNNTVDPRFAEKLFSLPKITDLLSAALRDCDDEKRRRAVMSFAIHGSYRLLLDWINQEERSPAEKEAALILELARRVCS